MASIIERIKLGCANNPMRVLISLTAPKIGLWRAVVLNALETEVTEPVSNPEHGEL